MSPEISELIEVFAKLPGLGPRSAKRLVIDLLSDHLDLIDILGLKLSSIKDKIVQCESCFNIDTFSPCSLCLDTSRNLKQICIVEKVSDMWAFENTKAYHGQYHILGGTLSPIDGKGPADINLPKLLARIQSQKIEEVILALNATVESQTTAHYLMNSLQSYDVRITKISQGIPLGGELNYLDEGTLITAFQARQ